MSSERLRLTRSADGVRRATLRVAFRIDAENLVRAAGYAIEHETCGTAVACAPRNALERLTRDEILEAARISFHEHGEVGSLVGGEHLGQTGPSKVRLREIAEARVRALFPEFSGGSDVE